MEREKMEPLQATCCAAMHNTFPIKTCNDLKVTDLSEFLLPFSPPSFKTSLVQNAIRTRREVGCVKQIKKIFINIGTPVSAVSNVQARESEPQIPFWFGKDAGAELCKTLSQTVREVWQVHFVTWPCWVWASTEAGAGQVSYCVAWNTILTVVLMYRLYLVSQP